MIAIVPAPRSRSYMSPTDQRRRSSGPPAGSGRRFACQQAPESSKVTERASRGELGPQVTIGSGRGPEEPTLLTAQGPILPTIGAKFETINRAVSFGVRSV